MILAVLRSTGRVFCGVPITWSLHGARLVSGLDVLLGGAELKPCHCAVAAGADSGPAEASVRPSGRPPLLALSRPSEPLGLFCGVKLVSLFRGVFKK